MTLLELVNGVLDRMREKRVTALSTSNPYQMMLVAQVNDAKRHVENAWDWLVLREKQAYTISAGNNAQILTNSDQPQFKILGAYDKDYNPLRQATLDWARKNVDSLDTVPTGTIRKYWVMPPERGARTKTVGLYPTADVNQGVVFDVMWNQADLADAADVLLVPSLPVLLFATAFVARERGEAGGTSVVEWMALAQKALGDAIIYDSEPLGFEQTWTDQSVWPSNNKM